MYGKALSYGRKRLLFVKSKDTFCFKKGKPVGGMTKKTPLIFKMGLGNQILGNIILKKEYF